MKMTEHRPLDDQELEHLFAAVRQSRPRPSNDLVERIIENSRPYVGAVDADSTTSVPGFLKVVLDTVGGIPAAVGFVTATVAGLAIGFFASVPLDGLSGGYLTNIAGFSLEDFMPSFIELIGEV